MNHPTGGVYVDLWWAGIMAFSIAGIGMVCYYCGRWDERRRTIWSPGGRRAGRATMSRDFYRPVDKA